MTDLPTELAAEIARVGRIATVDLGVVDRSLLLRSHHKAQVAFELGDTAAKQAALKDLEGYGNAD